MLHSACDDLLRSLGGNLLSHTDFTHQNVGREVISHLDVRDQFYFNKINHYLGHWHLEENVEDGAGVEKPVEDVEDGQIIGLLAEMRGTLDHQAKPVVDQDVSSKVRTQDKV